MMPWYLSTMVTASRWSSDSTTLGDMHLQISKPPNACAWIRRTSFTAEYNWFSNCGTVRGLSIGKAFTSFPQIYFPACLSKYVSMTAIGAISLHIITSLRIEMLQSRTWSCQLVASMHKQTQCVLSKLKGKYNLQPASTLLQPAGKLSNKVGGNL